MEKISDSAIVLLTLGALMEIWKVLLIKLGRTREDQTELKLALTLAPTLENRKVGSQALQLPPPRRDSYRQVYYDDKISFLFCM